MSGVAPLATDLRTPYAPSQHTRTLQQFSRLFHSRLQYLVDLGVLASALTGAYLLRFDFDPPPEIRIQLLHQISYVVLVQYVALILAGVYGVSWQHVGRAELRLFVAAAAMSVVPLFALRIALPDSAHVWRVPLSVAVLDTLLMLLGLIAVRVLQKELYERYRRRHDGRRIRRVLVIGGAGYVGSALLPKLLAEGYHVRVLDLLVYGTEAIEDVLDHPRLEVVRADFRQIDRVVDSMRGVDAVVHLGGLVGDPACAVDENLTIEINLMATRMIAEVAKGWGISRLVFASTCSVYGASDQVLNESSALNPISLYARSKIASERVLLKMADTFFAPTILRFGTIYGLSGRTRFDLVVNLLAAKALVEGQITVKGGDQWRPFLHVEDAATAVMQALQAPLAVVRAQTFNVGSDDQNFTIQEVGELIHSLVPTARLVNLGPDTDRRNYRVAFAKIRAALGFTPEWTIDAGVRQVLRAIEGGHVKDYRDAKYSNVKHLTDESTPRLLRQEGWAYDLLNETARPATPREEEAALPPPGRRMVHLVSGAPPA
jgi:nucleoside-diphosphate-sugar epimerase